MKHLIFYREDNDFTDILKDKNLKKVICRKISWNQYLLIGCNEKFTDEVKSYVMLKYGEDYREAHKVFKDYTPIPFVDYTPINMPDKFRKK